MSAERFMQLVVEKHGFEFVQAYKDDVDLFLGGKDGTFWYVVMKNGKVKMAKTWYAQKQILRIGEDTAI